MAMEFRFKYGKTFTRLVALVVLFLFVAVPIDAEAQSPLDEQLNRVVSVFNTFFTPPCTSTQTRDCTKVTKNGGIVNVSDDRMVNQARERTSINVLASLTAAEAQNTFKQKAKFYSDPANNMFHGTLFTSETFAANPGPSQDAVLQVSLSPNDSQQGDAMGYMVCGNLGLELSMTLFHPSTTGVVGQQAVSNTQRELKTMMQKITSALSSAGVCGATKPKLLSLVPLGDVTPSVRNDADPTAVYPGDKVKVTGVVFAVEGFDGIFPKNPLNVQAKVEISQGVSSNVQRVTTDAQGYYEAEYLVLDDRVPVIVVEAISPDPNRYEGGNRLYELNIKKRGSLTVRVATDKAVYAPGETVTVSGNVLADGKPTGAAIGFRSDILPLTSITSGSGSFQYTFTPGQERQRNVLGPFQNGLHIVSVEATVLGYDGGSASATYLVEQSLTCTSLSAQVADLGGVARVLPINPQDLQASNDPAVAQILAQRATLSTNTKLTQGLKVTTDAGARVALRFAGEQGATATVAVRDSTTVRIEKFCKDKTSGRIQVVLSVDSPGQVVVNKTTTGSIFSNIDVAIATRAVRVKSINTRYFVGVTDDGTTTIAALQDTALVSMPDGTNGINLPAVNRIIVHPGEKPDASKITPMDGQIDPGLEKLLGGESVPEPNTNVTGMTIQAAQRQVITGDLVVVPVWLIKANNVANLNLQVTFDANVIRPEGAIGKGNLLDNALFTPNANQGGIIRAAFARSSGIAGTGTVINIPFRAIGKPGDRTQLDVTVTTINDPNGGVLKVDRIPGEVWIYSKEGAFPSPPTAPPGGGTPPGPPPPPKMLQGDCDGDGNISEVDGLCALEMSTQLRPVSLNVDMDNSGDVTSRDVVIILKGAVGK